MAISTTTTSFAIAIGSSRLIRSRTYPSASTTYLRLWNPLTNRMEDREQTERRIAAFVAVGLDEFRIRAWTVIRGAYLRPSYADQIGALLHAAA